MDSNLEKKIYIADYRDIKPGVVLKTKLNVMYQIVGVERGTWDDWDANHDPYRGKWTLEVRFIKGAKFDDTEDGESCIFDRDTTFTLKADPNELLAWMHNVSDNELAKLAMLGRITY